jgi:hypothetical protein
MPGEPPFEGAHCFHRRLPGGDLAVVVGAAFGVVTELGDGHDVQGAVDLAVARPGQAVADVVTGRGGRSVRCRARRRSAPCQGTG